MILCISVVSVVTSVFHFLFYWVGVSLLSVIKHWISPLPLPYPHSFFWLIFLYFSQSLTFLSIYLCIYLCILAIWCKELTCWKRPWCWERLNAGGEGNDRGWDGRMASLTQWTWAWASSGRQWRTGKPGLGVAKSPTWLSDWTTIYLCIYPLTYPSIHQSVHPSYFLAIHLSIIHLAG